MEEAVVCADCGETAFGMYVQTLSAHYVGIASESEGISGPQMIREMLDHGTLRPLCQNCADGFDR